MQAPCLLPETLTRVELRASGTIVAGVILATAFGSHVEQEYTACSLFERYKLPDFYVTVIVVVLLIAASLYALHFAGRPPAVEMWRPALFALIAGLFGALQNIFFKGTGESQCC